MKEKDYAHTADPCLKTTTSFQTKGVSVTVPAKTYISLLVRRRERLVTERRRLLSKRTGDWGSAMKIPKVMRLAYPRRFPSLGGVKVPRVVIPSYCFKMKVQWSKERQKLLYILHKWFGRFRYQKRPCARKSEISWAHFLIHSLILLQNVTIVTDISLSICYDIPPHTTGHGKFTPTWLCPFLFASIFRNAPSLTRILCDKKGVMQFVQCESCLKRIERNKAETFEDKDFFIHFACPEHLLDAMSAYRNKVRSEIRFVESIEQCA